MTLFGSLQVASAATQAHQAALRVVGNNIANVNTQGYVRDEVRMSPSRPQNLAGTSFGTGVSVASVSQQVDSYLLERSREASSEYAASETRVTYLERLEKTLNELGDSDLSSKLESFFGSLQDVQNQPDSTAVRSIVVQQGQLVADAFRATMTEIDRIRTDINREVTVGANQINDRVANVVRLNQEIVAAEAARDDNTAGGLRVLRDQELQLLAGKIDLHVVETESGSVNLFADNIPLLINGKVERVEAREASVGQLPVQRLVFEKSGTAVPVEGGRLGGAQRVRDDDLVAVQDALSQLASEFIFEFNKLHSSGTGLESYTEVTSGNFVRDPALALDDPNVGLNFPVQNGSFEIRFTDLSTGQETTALIDVDLDGTAPETALDDGTANSIVSQIDAAFGTSVASVTAQGKLRITAPPGVEFAFGADTSGFLASMGVNTFFTGQDARTIGVSSALQQKPGLFAAGQSSLPGDVSNTVAMVGMQEEGLANLDGLSVSSFYTAIVSDLGVVTESAAIEADSLDATRRALESENLSVTGVNLDEETLKLIQYQRGFQASARYISTLNELMDEILNIVR